MNSNDSKKFQKGSCEKVIDLNVFVVEYGKTFKLPLYASNWQHIDLKTDFPGLANI